MFRSRRDAEITIGIYKRCPGTWRDEPEGNPWGILFLRMFDMANDSGLFHTREELEHAGWTLAGNVFIRGEERMLPLYEAKMIHLLRPPLRPYRRPEGSPGQRRYSPRLTS